MRKIVRKLLERFILWKCRCGNRDFHHGRNVRIQSGAILCNGGKITLADHTEVRRFAVLSPGGALNWASTVRSGCSTISTAAAD